MLHSAAVLAGMASKALDFRYSQKMDLEGPFGYLLTLNCLRHVREHGVVWFAIPCASWVFLSRGSTRRSSLRLKGSARFSKVLAANRLLKRILYLSGPYARKEQGAACNLH